MANELTFTKNGSRYEAEIISAGEPITVQIDRSEKKDLTVYGAIDGMEQVALFTTSILQNVLFQVDVPEGLKVKIVSWAPVTSAKTI